MVVKVHLSGVAIAYEPKNSFHRHDSQPINAISRPQGSLYGQQKRAICDAVEWMRLNAAHKPMFFVVTTPGYKAKDNHEGKIKKFTHNLKHGYGCEHYVWVRELTKTGLPHYHFVASIPFIQDPVGLSLYWSRLFGSDSTCSVRLGSAPGVDGKRLFYVDSPKAARYISKYIGKGLQEHQQSRKEMADYLIESGFPQARFKPLYRERNFAISEQVRIMSKPVQYESCYQFEEREAWNHSEQKVTVRYFRERTFEDELGQYVHPEEWEWRKVEGHNVFFGVKKQKS